jgi:RNA polymerase sigma factor (sigma-70 family)
VTNSELLREYAASRSQDAFRQLVERYGRMVYSTSLRRLGNPYEAEDVAQAVFIALARKAARIRPEALSAWLYRAADLGSLRCLRDRKLRSKREREAAEMVAEPEREKAWRAARPELDRALSGLPMRYRQVITMHYLAGQPVAEVARELGKPVGTVRSLLSRGIGRLRKRLVRRGATQVPVAVLAAALTHGAASEVMPAGLVDVITSAALGTGTASTGAGALSGGILSSMFWAKCKVIALVLTLVAFTGLGGGAAITSLLHAGPRPTAFYRDMPDNTWVLVDDGSKLHPPRGLLGFSGGTIDIEGRRLYVFGGGHSGYAGNDVWSWHIDERRWQRLYAPDRIAGLPLEETRRSVDNDRFPGMWLPSGRPLPRSSYSSVEFIAHRGLMTLGGFSTWCGRDSKQWKSAKNPDGAYPCVPADFWTFDPDGCRWTYRGSAKQKNPEQSMPRGVTAAVYIPDSRLLIAVDMDSRTWSYDIETNIWTRRADGGNGYHPCLTYDRRRKLVYGTARQKVGEQQQVVLRAYDPALNAWRKLRPQGESPRTGENAEGITYDSLNDVVLLLGGDGFWVYSPGENRWRRNPSVSAAHPPKAGYFNRLRYDPVNNVTFCFGEKVWAYRYRRSR